MSRQYCKGLICMECKLVKVPILVGVKLSVD
jgi:hypothetical protein